MPPVEKRDPIHRWFFEDNNDNVVKTFNNFITRQTDKKQKVVETVKKQNNSITNFLNGDEK